MLSEPSDLPRPPGRTRQVRRRRPEAQTFPQAVSAVVTPDFRVALLAGVVAVAALVVQGALGDVHGPHLHQRLFAIGASVGFLVFSVLAVRNVAGEVYRVLVPRTGRSHADVVRWSVTLVGYAIVLLTTLGLLDVPVKHLLLGGALTGVIVGIAAQQALGNVFAGVVLLLARPFSVGDAIRLRSGTLGGELTGTVTGVGLTYVSLDTGDGPLSVPNSVVLGAGIGPRRVTDVAAQAPVTSSPSPAASAPSTNEPTP